MLLCRAKNNSVGDTFRCSPAHDKQENGIPHLSVILIRNIFSAVLMVSSTGLRVVFSLPSKAPKYLPRFLMASIILWHPISYLGSAPGYENNIGRLWRHAKSFFFFFFHINYYYHFYYLYKPFSALRQLFPLASRSRLTRDRALLLIDSGHVTMM